MALSGAMATTAKTMGEMNKVMRPEAIGQTMRDFQQANMKMEMTDEMSELFFKYLLKLIYNNYICFGFQSMKLWTTF